MIFSLDQLKQKSYLDGQDCAVISRNWRSNCKCNEDDSSTELHLTISGKHFEDIFIRKDDIRSGPFFSNHMADWEI